MEAFCDSHIPVVGEEGDACTRWSFCKRARECRGRLDPFRAVGLRIAFSQSFRNSCSPHHASVCDMPSIRVAEWASTMRAGEGKGSTRRPGSCPARVSPVAE